MAKVGRGGPGELIMEEPDGSTSTCDPGGRGGRGTCSPQSRGSATTPVKDARAISRSVCTRVNTVVSATILDLACNLDQCPLGQQGRIVTAGPPQGAEGMRTCSGIGVSLQRTTCFRPDTIPCIDKVMQVSVCVCARQPARARRLAASSKSGHDI